MNIVYDGQIFCAQTYGGISRYFCELAARISRQPGAHAAIAAPMYINAHLKWVPQALVFGFPAPGARRLATTPSARFLGPALRGLGLLLGDRMLRDMNPDIVHETYYFPHRLGPRRARRVMTIHDMIPEMWGGRSLRMRALARCKALAALRADHIICVSEATRRDAVRILGLPSGKTSVTHLGFESRVPASGSPASSAGLGTEPFLLYVGRREGYKNFDRLLEAYAASSRLRRAYKLVCFGGGPFRAYERTRMRSLGLGEDHIVQLGGDDGVLAHVYARATLLVFPSLHEGFGLTLLEAMAHGCPVVCGNRSAIPEVVGDAGEYFDPTETEEMRTAIERVAASDSHRSALAAKGRARIQCFSWDRCAVETMTVYETLS